MEKFTIDFLKNIKDDDLIYWTYQTYQDPGKFPKNKKLLDFIDEYSESLNFIEYGEQHTDIKNAFLTNQKNILILTFCDEFIKKNMSDEYEYKSADLGTYSRNHFSEFNIPSKINRIYSKNSFITDNPKIICLPNGICNKLTMEGVLRKRHRIYDSDKRHSENLLYCNVGIEHTKHNRPHNIKILKSMDIKENWQSWPNFNEVYGINYFEGMYKHKFVFSPEGNAPDSHRTWEALYAGSIPIVIKNCNMQHFKDLPILMIDDWSDLSKDFLKKKYIEIMSKEWNLEKLKLSYWLKIIEEDIKWDVPLSVLRRAYVNDRKKEI